MEDTENKDVKMQDIVEPEKSQESLTQPEANKTTEPKEGSKEFNWRKMEEKHKKEMEQLQLELREIRQKYESTVPKEDEPKIEEDDFITFSQQDKLVEKKARAIFQDEYKKVEKAKQPLVARSKYPDFDQVVTLENIDKLKEEDPELEKLILLAENPYERTYKEIKRSNFYKSSMANKESEEKIAENSKKPVSSNSLGKQRPLSYANDYAKGDQSLWKEMQYYARKATSV